MVDPISIIVGILQFIVNVVLGFIIDALIDFLLDLLGDLADVIIDALVELLSDLLDRFLEWADPVTLLALALMIGGVIGTFVPLVPGPLLSILGVLIYWWHSGFSDPGVGWVLAFVLVGSGAMAADYLGGLVSARVGGASTTTSVAASVVGLVLLFAIGPLGLIVGVMGTVFGLEYYRHEDGERAAKSAGVTLGGLLGSMVAQAILTGLMLVLMVWFVLF